MKRPAERIPDTNAIIRYLLGDHPTLLPKAEEFFARVRTGEQKVLILESVIAEAIYVLTKAYSVPRAKAASGLMGLLNYRGVSNHELDGPAGCTCPLQHQQAGHRRLSRHRQSSPRKR